VINSARSPVLDGDQEPVTAASSANRSIQGIYMIRRRPKTAKMAQTKPKSMTT
jgi:hypothetical protein